MDYYSILGVSKNASPEDLKKAYKKQSMQHHPDRGGDEAKFKEINEAYSTLKDPQKRAAYDNPQPRFHTGNMNGNPFGQAGFEDIFASMFGARHQARPRNSDVRIRVKITLEEVFSGKNIIATYRLRNGQEESVTIDIPPGVDHGDTIKYANLGDNSLPGKRGDLYVEIFVTNKPNWNRNQNDLETTIEVDCLKMIVGTKTLVNTLDGRQLELTIPKGTKNGTTFSIHGYGVPNARTGQKGKLLIHVKATIPQNLKASELQRIREIVNDNS